MKSCSSCRQEKPADQFSRNASRHDGMQAICRPCQSDSNKKYYRSSGLRREAIRARTKAQRLANIKFVAEYLADHPCVDCGEADLVVLDFDHVRGEKRSGISELSRSWCASLKTIEAEIAKCEVRCANCHRRRTHERRLRA